MHPRVLIVGTLPYNKQASSRAFGTYFANWEKENLAQVFSSNKKPLKGHCQKLYQITDESLLKRRFKRKTVVGTEFTYDELDKDDSKASVSSGVIKKLYHWGTRQSPFRFLLRKALWRKKYWNTKKFDAWLNEFNPEAVFLSSSNDFFIQEIALHVAKKFNIPIISSIADDYYFDGKFSLSVFYHIYKIKYRRLLNKVMAYPGDVIYISDKIRDKYNMYFNCNGKTLHLTSDISRREFRPIAKLPKITYFGNIRMGRNHSLVDIANALYAINPDIKLDVCSNEMNLKYIRPLTKNKAIRFNGAIPYQKVQDEMYHSDISVIVEGFKKKDVAKSRYSLSTKVADTLRSGVNILAYGSIDCGAIEYLRNTNGVLTITAKSELNERIANFLNNPKLQKKHYEITQIITEKNHNLETNAKLFDNIVIEALKKFKK